MPLDIQTAIQHYQNLRFQRAFGSTVATPSGRAHVLVGPALHSETLECLVVLFHPDSGFKAVAPGALRDTDEELAIDADALFQRDCVAHKKGGLYTRLAAVLGRDGDLVLYAAHKDGLLWLRPAGMFNDGRFSAASEAPMPLSEIDM